MYVPLENFTIAYVAYISIGQCWSQRNKSTLCCPCALLAYTVMGRWYLHVNPYPREPQCGAEAQDCEKVERKGESGGLGWLWQVFRRSSGEYGVGRQRAPLEGCTDCE